MKWFKFYGQDYLSDPKMLALNACERSCWITILAYGSVNDDGKIEFLDEEQLMAQAGISPMHEEWDETKGVLKKLEKLKMIKLNEDKITICNWDKRQDSYLTEAERAKRYRENKKESDDRHAEVTLEEKRVEEKRVDKREKRPEASLTYLLKVPLEDLKEFTKVFHATETEIKRKAEKMHGYCQAKGKVYKNYKAFLRNGLDGDFRRKEDVEKEIFKPPESNVTDDQAKKNREKLAEMKKNLFNKTL